MQHEPAAELYVYARELSPNYKAIIDRPEWELATQARDWRRFISPPLRHLWPRLAWGEKLALYVNAEQTRVALAKKRGR